MDARARAELEDTSRSATLPEKAAGPLGSVRALDPGRIAALGGVTLAFLGFFASIIWRASTPDYTLLFVRLELSDSERLVQRLEEMGVPHRLSAGGDAIMVSADRVLRLRRSLAEEGMPLGAAVGYELLDRAGPFGTSSPVPRQHPRRTHRRAGPEDAHARSRPAAYDPSREPIRPQNTRYRWLPTKARVT